jgi:hypothetical protein
VAESPAVAGAAANEGRGGVRAFWAKTLTEQAASTVQRRWIGAALIYALAIVYGSIAVGPEGHHFARLSLGEALHRAAAIRFFDNGSDQRADWIANLLMLVPLGCMVRGVLSREGTRLGQAMAILASFQICLLFVLMVKFAQLYFPPRTVSLNYILAQSFGAFIGVMLFDVVRARLYPMLWRLSKSGDGLVILLGIYTVWLIAYFLTPFDFVLSAGELRAHLANLPPSLGSWPGGGQKPGFRLLLVAADTLATVPVGMFLAVAIRQWRFPGKLLLGFAAMVVIELLALLVLSATPFAIAIVYRTAGVALGLYVMERLEGKDLRKRHYYFSRFIPIALPVYALLVAFGAGLLTRQWVTLDQAIHSLEPEQLLPFWNYYIVTKAHAARSFVINALVYAPIGTMIWVRRGFWSKGAAFSATVAFFLSLLVEIGRWLKPGLRPDFSDPVIAAAAAAIMFRAMPTLWRMFEREVTRSAPVDRYVAPRRTSAERAGAV